MSNYKSTLQSNNEQLSSNNLDLQSLIDQANALPDAGPDLPELTNEGSALDLMSGKQLIDSEGNKVTGTFTIASELDSQDTLISQIQTALQGKAAGGTPVEFITGTVSLADGADWSDMGQSVSYMSKNFTWSEGLVPRQGTLEITTLKNGIILCDDTIASVVNGKANYHAIPSVAMVYDSNFDIKLTD